MKQHINAALSSQPVAMCPECGGATKVTDSRNKSRVTSAPFSAVRRRRECLDCSKRYTTYELTEKSIDKLAEENSAAKSLLEEIDFFREKLGLPANN